MVERHQHQHEEPLQGFFFAAPDSHRARSSAHCAGHLNYTRSWRMPPARWWNHTSRLLSELEEEAAISPRAFGRRRSSSLVAPSHPLSFLAVSGVFHLTH